MKTGFGIGDQVRVTSHREYALCTQNASGGTISMKPDSPIRCKIIKEWNDYEIGQRYVGKMKGNKEVYFGEFNVTIEAI